MDERLIVSGTGGQGVQFVGRFICWYALLKDLDVSFVPSYGAEMRGGSTSAQIVISTGKIYFPVVTEANTIVLLDKPGIEKYATLHTQDTEIIYNSDIIKTEEIKEIFTKTQKLSGLKGKQMSHSFKENAPINIPFIYGFLSKKNIYTEDLVKATLEKILEKKEKLIAYNIDYFKFLNKTASDMYI